jgi:hypothetical protein
MDQAMIRRHLEKAERHVRDGIARQREIVCKLELRSPESVTLRIARGLLQEVERAQGIHVADRDRLRGLLLP